MANEKLISQICAIQRGLGIIEGVASGLSNEQVSQMLYTATEMIDEAVGRLQMANEKRLIWDEDAKRHLIALAVGHNTETLHIDMILNAILHHATTVEAVEVVHGRWVKHKPKPEAMRAWHRQGIGKAMSENSIFWTCSCCEEWGTPRYNYCPHCGAKMDGGN